jgi:hypothetical protein
MKEKFVKYDQDKIDFSMITPNFLAGMSRVLMHGAKKYSRDNWKNADTKDGLQRYKSALLRHVIAYTNGGEVIDGESGFAHIFHASCCLMFLEEFERRKKKERIIKEVVEYVNREGERG